MLLKRLIFDNYKTYYGHQEIDFYIPEEIREEENKNIILIGGLNGTGKTTILKVILYVLFGKRGISESEYKKLFSNVINNIFFDEGGRDCSVILFIETDKKEEWELKVTWSFDNYKRVIQENRYITVRKPGVKHGRRVNIDNIEAFNRFIDRIIPYHAAPFFIFDGEEIKEVILRQNSKEMKDSIHKITGMETYKLFLRDLKEIESKLQKDLTKSSNNKKLTNIQKSLDDEIEKVVKLNEKLVIIQKEKNSLIYKIEKLKDIRNKLLKSNSISRKKLIEEKVKFETIYFNLYSQFQESFSKDAILVILKDKITALIKRINREKKIRNKKISIEESLKPYRTFMNKLFEIEFDPPLSNNQLQQIKNLGEEIWRKENNIDLKIDDNIEEIHDISPNEYNILTSLNDVKIDIFINILNELDKLEQKISQIDQKLHNAPEYIDISIENNKIELLHKKIGEYELKERTVKIKIKKSTDERKKLENQYTRIKDEITNIDNSRQKYNTISRIVDAMEQFIEQSTLLKAHFIKEEFTFILKKLFRKNEEFGNINFDINSYSIKLYNDREQEISIEDRSAGEMQMISSALIWALTKASDLSLPMVIDTPLGRLDSIHRKHLIDYYYKSLSDQVIILSTDTEISDEYVDIMKENSYKQYMLNYDEKKKYTIIRDGYFEFIK